MFLQSGSFSVSFALNEHCSLLFIVGLMATLTVVSIQTEGERVADQSLYDINILVAEEVVIALKLSVSV